MAESAKVIDRHIAAFNARNADDEPWSANAELVAPGTTANGRDDVLGFLTVFQEAFPDGQLTLSRMLLDGTRASVEGIFSGTHDGVLHSPNGDVPPSGRPVKLRWSAFYETAGDELVSEHLYFDQVDFLAQLGLAPS